MKKIIEIFKKLIESIREKLTFFIDTLIPDEDITKTSILFWFISYQLYKKGYKIKS